MYTCIKYMLFLLILKGVLSDFCIKHKTCNDCITEPGCVYCSTAQLNENKCREKEEVNDKMDWCPGTIQNPESVKSIPNEPNEAVQLKPHKYNMKLRPGDSLDFDFTFQADPNYPLDIYFLMDASMSMSSFLKKSVNDDIYNELKQINDNLYLGFGTFIDKNAMPIVRDISKNKTFSFKNILPLTKDTTKFQEVYKAIDFGENRDKPEGGLDALAQVMVCQCIKWRKDSRKIVLFITDDSYHVAGDGRFIGIFKPYDGQCYTGEDGVYKNELIMDYPSKSMINKLAHREEIVIVFAVESSAQYAYEKLKYFLSTSHVTAYDEKDKSTLIEIVREIYNSISKTIQLEVFYENGLQNLFDIKFDPDCQYSADAISSCKIKSGKKQSFTGTIKLREYDGTNNRTSIDISVKGLKERLTLDIEVIHECECEKTIKNTPNCNGEPEMCGDCVCGADKYGEKCACTRNSNSIKDTSTCRPLEATIDCNGRGHCVCGSCDCERGYDGRYCQCNMKGCPIGQNGKVCSGHGTCQCENCKCDLHFIGNACDCHNSTVNCMTDNNKICNGLGDCVCNSCKCKSNALWDMRNPPTPPKCDKPKKDCPICHNMQCSYIQTCALCKLNEEETCECEDFDVEVISNIPENYYNDTDWKICNDLRVKIGCYTDVLYKYDDDNYRLLIKVEKGFNCAETAYIAGGISLGILILIGICSIIGWKLLTDARDRSEYMKFIAEHEDEIGTNMNPCYEPPTTTFKNPAYRKDSYRS